MRCYICMKPVYGSEGVTVPKYGPAHRTCFEAKLALRRSFEGLEISDLSEDQLTNLHDLVLAEINDRKGTSDDDDFELF